jgi:hypothetical protein
MTNEKYRLRWRALYRSRAASFVPKSMRKQFVRGCMPNGAAGSLPLVLHSDLMNAPWLDGVFLKSKSMTPRDSRAWLHSSLASFGTMHFDRSVRSRNVGALLRAPELPAQSLCGRDPAPTRLSFRTGAETAVITAAAVRVGPPLAGGTLAGAGSASTVGQAMA